MIGIRIHVNHGGGHVHFGVYAGHVPEGHAPAQTTYGFCGLLTMQNAEYEAFVAALVASDTIHFEEILTEVVHG